MHPRRLQRIAQGIPPIEDTFLRSAFRVPCSEVRSHFEGISRAALQGFHASLSGTDTETLRERIFSLPVELQGFGWKGAGIGLVLLQETALGLGSLDAHSCGFMLRLGAGWALARIPLLREHEQAFQAGGDSLLRSIPLVGLGAHQAFFHWTRFVDQQREPAGFSVGAQRIFDQGVGFALWFGEGGDHEAVLCRVAQFHPVRQPVLWSGVGFACAYIGKSNISSLKYLREASGPFFTYLAQGAALAAMVRQRENTLVAYTDLACHVLCGLGASTAATIVEEMGKAVHIHPTDTVYDRWVSSVRVQLVRPDL